MAIYYIARDGKQTGPFEETAILRQIEDGSLSSSDLCWREGMADWQPIVSVLNVTTRRPSPLPIPATPTSGPAQAAPLFLHIPVARLIVLSIVSFSVYEAYWIYRNWRYVKERDSLTIRPFWRGVFGIFNCHSLLRRIHEDTEARVVEEPAFSPGNLATGWVVLMIVSNAISRAPGIVPTLLAAFVPSFLCFVPVQNYVNRVTQRRSPGAPYYRWSSGHLVCLAFGIVMWALLLIGLAAE